MAEEVKYTPMMMQYLEHKKNYQDCIVFYRLGDFYEMFFDDAKIASQELDLVLTGRNAGQEDRVPMCGIPYHAANGYIQRLTQKGYKVAIIEQLEEATAGKIVQRGCIKIVTPGTWMDDNGDEKQSAYIASIVDTQFGPLPLNTFVIAAVNVVFPWSTCPIVPMLTWGLERSNFSFAILNFLSFNNYYSIVSNFQNNSRCFSDKF